MQSAESREQRTSLNLSPADLAQIEAMLDRYSRCSKHRLILACLRIGLAQAMQDPSVVPRYAGGHVRPVTFQNQTP